MCRHISSSEGQPAVFKVVVHCGTLSDVHQGSSTLCLLHAVTIVYNPKRSQHGQCFCKLQMWEDLYYDPLPIDSNMFWKMTMSNPISAKMFCKSMQELHLTSESSRLQARLVNTRWKKYTSLCALWSLWGWRQWKVLIIWKGQYNDLNKLHMHVQFRLITHKTLFNNSFKATSHSTHFYPENSAALR